MNSFECASAGFSFSDEPVFAVSSGCDVDSQRVHVAVYRVETGNISGRVYSQTQRGATAAAKWLEANQVEIVILESTANYHLLFYHTFRKRGLNAHVINPRLIKALLAVEGKSDKADAANLARMAAHFRMRTSNMPDEMQMEIRMNLRKWDADKVARTRESNALRAMMTAYGVPIFRRVKPVSVSGRDFIQVIAHTENVSPREAVNFAWRGHNRIKPELVELLANLPDLPAYVREEVALAAAELDRLTDRIETRRARAQAHMQQFELGTQIKWMISAPAVTPLLALRIVAETGADYHARYHSAEAFGKACGLAPSNKVSGGKLLKSAKGHGNKYIKSHFTNSVRGWLQTKADHPLKRWYLQYRQRAGYKRAVNATAHKIAKSLWHMGHNGGQVYHPRGLAEATSAIEAQPRH